MAVINLRGVPDELARTVKATAASEGLTLREFVIGVLERDVRRGGWTAPRAVDVERRFPVEREVPVAEARSLALASLPGVSFGIPEIPKDAEIDLCGHREFMEADRVWMICGRPVHKGNRHGDWVREEVDG